MLERGNYQDQMMLNSLTIDRMFAEAAQAAAVDTCPNPLAAGERPNGYTVALVGRRLR